MKARKGFFNLKKSKDQRMLRKSCIENIKKAVFSPCSDFLSTQTKKRESPISRYNKVHTGANIHDGGLKGGLLRVRYQLPTDEEVKTEPIAPADRQIIIDANSLKNFTCCILFKNFL